MKRTISSNRTTAVAAGLLFVIATVANVVGTQLSSPITSDSEYLTRISLNSQMVEAGALLELIAALACAGIAISLYSVLRKWNTGLALGSVVFRTIEAIMYIVGVVSLLSLLTVSQQFTTAAPSERASIQATGDLLLTIRGQVVAPAVLAFSLGAFMYYYLFFRSDLIPRWLSGWGIVAVILTMGACVLSWFSRSPLTTYTIALLPIAVQEIALAVWLIVRGFNSSALGASSGPGGVSINLPGERRPSDTTRAPVAERTA
jgi:hypothetical protein